MVYRRVLLHILRKNQRRDLLVQRQIAIVQWLGIERELLRGETKPGTLMTSFRHEIEDVACYLLGLIGFCHMS